LAIIIAKSFSPNLLKEEDSPFGTDLEPVDYDDDNIP